MYMTPFGKSGYIYITYISYKCCTAIQETCIPSEMCTCGETRIPSDTCAGKHASLGIRVRETFYVGKHPYDTVIVVLYPCMVTTCTCICTGVSKNSRFSAVYIQYMCTKNLFLYGQTLSYCRALIT